MLLKNKNAVIYGAGGAIGSAVAHAFVREGAMVCLTGRSLEKIDALAKEISDAGGVVHADEAAKKMGSIDISFNVINIPHVQGMPLVDLPVEDFALPVMN